MNETTAPKKSRKRLIQMLFGAVVMVLTFAFLIPRIANYSDVWLAARSMTPAQLTLLIVVAAWNLVTFAPSWQVALPGLRYRQSLEVTFASTAVANVMPAGSAVSFGISWAMLREWGFEGRAVARAMILTGVWNHLLNVGFPLIALLMLTLDGGKSPILTRAAIAGAVLFVLSIGVLVLILRSPAQARRVGHWWDRVATAVLRPLRKRPIVGSADALERFRTDSIILLRRRWLALTAAALLGTLSVFLVLLVAVRVTGIGAAQLDLIEVFTAWSLVRLLTALPITPGGIGIAELGLVGMLTQLGGDEAAVVAAVLLFRALTFLPPIVLGMLVAFTWRRHPHPSLDGLGSPT